MKHLFTLALLCCGLPGCGTYESLVTVHPELANTSANALAFSKCADIAGPALVLHYSGRAHLTTAQIAALVIETAACGLKTADELHVENARESVGIPATVASGSFPNPEPLLPNPYPALVVPKAELQ